MLTYILTLIVIDRNIEGYIVAKVLIRGMIKMIVYFFHSKMKLKILLISASFLAFIPTQKTFASVLTFDIDNITNGNSIPSDYGDNITAETMGNFSYLEGNGFTPNIAVEYRTFLASDFGTGDNPQSSNLNFWGSGYSGLTGVAYANPNGRVAEISFIPEAGYGVRLNSFDLGTFISAIDNQPLAIYDGDYNLLANLGLTTITNASSLTFSPNITHDGILRLQFGNNFNVGIDNINFDQIANSQTSQPVPEPGFVMGLIFMAMFGITPLRNKAK